MTSETTRYGFRAVHPDFRSRNGYVWPFPGHTAYAAGPFDPNNRGGCPRYDGDGICLATTAAGAASGGIPLVTVLLCSYSPADVLGSECDGAKIRVTKAEVLSVHDFPATLRFVIARSGYLPTKADLRSADLSGANLSGADLSGANLRGADLRDAGLRGANLSGADLLSADLRDAGLRGANLSGADLRSADLRDADLRSANLHNANLRDADLYGANLHNANLRDADLYGANLRSANLRYANLRGADPYGADLYGADLYGAYADAHTKVPTTYAVRGGRVVAA